MRILLAAIYPYFFLLLYFIIPFDNYVRALPNILLAILALTFPFIVKKSDFKKIKRLPFFIFICFIAFLLLNSWTSERFFEDYNVIKKILIAIGLVVLYIPILDGDSSNKSKEKINNAIIFSSLAAIIYSIFNFVLITHETGSFALGDSPQVVESLLIDRLYLGLLSIFSILISIQSIKKTYDPNNNYYLANILINALFIVLIASKIALVGLLLLLLIRQFYGKRKIWKIFVVVFSISAIIGLFFVLKNYGNKEWKTDTNPSISSAFIQNSMTYELRAVVWQCASNIINDEGLSLTGNGFIATENKLVDCYSHTILNEQKRNDFIGRKYNTHNQFLDFYMSAGFIALLLFLIFIVVSLFSVRKCFLSTALLAILILYCMIENVFHRQIGAYYIGFILIVIMTNALPLENNDIKEI